MKTCTVCKETKNVTEFHKKHTSKDGLKSSCKTCCKIINAKRTRDYNSKASKKSIIKRKHESLIIYQHSQNINSIKFRYGITEETLQNMLLKQQGCCDICKADFGTLLIPGKPNSRQYHIDHNHKTRKVRGLVCGTCNNIIECVENRNITMNNTTHILQYLEKYDEV